MINKLAFALVVAVFISLISINGVLAADPTMIYIDDWSRDGGSTKDGVVWGGKSLKLDFASLDSNADVICVDWCKEGNDGYDHCFIKSGVLPTFCDSSYQVKSKGVWKNPSQLFNGACNFNPYSCTHTINTGSSGQRWICTIDAVVFYNCINLPPLFTPYYKTVTRPYFVVYPKETYCDSNPKYYDHIGLYDTLKAVIYNDDVSCPSYTLCDGDPSHNKHDLIEVKTESGSLPNPCSTIDGSSSNYACSTWRDCYSGVCGGGGQKQSSRCSSDGSDRYYIDTETWKDTCGGSGYKDSSSGSSNYCSNYKSSTVCDSTKTGSSKTSPGDFCRTSEYGSCTSGSECWHYSTYLCMGSSGNRICTTGDNGKSCFNNDDNQCRSGRCDVTCQDKLSNGQYCDENSDCLSEACISNKCGSSKPFIYLTDNWDYSHSTREDAVAFTGYQVNAEILNLKAETDMVCYDWDSDSNYDTCYYNTKGCGGGGCNSNSCNYYVIPSAVTDKAGCDLTNPGNCVVGSNVPAKICNGCKISTSSIKRLDVDALVYYDCDNSRNQRGSELVEEAETADDFFIVNPKFYLCKDSTDYYAAGKYSSQGNVLWKTLSCSSSEMCDNEARSDVASATANIPSICRTKNGYSCTSNSQCYSGLCQGTCKATTRLQGILKDHKSNPLVNQEIRFVDCNTKSVIARDFTKNDGSFTLLAPSGPMQLEVVFGWGSVILALEGNNCYTHKEGRYVFQDPIILTTETTIKGKFVNPKEQPINNLPVELQTCQDVLRQSTKTNSLGDFKLVDKNDRYQIKIDLGGKKIPVVDANKNSCFFFYKDVDLGKMTVNTQPDCKDYDNTCYNKDWRLYDCSYSSQKNACLCYYEICKSGCTNGKPYCNNEKTGEIAVTVSDKTTGKPVSNSVVYLDEYKMGNTNSYGKLSFKAYYGYREVKVLCPDNKFCAMEGFELGSSYKALSYKCLCGNKKGEILLSVRTPDGYPVANAYVFIDGEYDIEILTNPFGYAYIKDVNTGSHDIQIIYNVSLNPPKLFSNSTKATIKEGLNKISLTIQDPRKGFVGGSLTMKEITGKDGGLVSGAVVAAVVTGINIVSIGMGVNDVCNCLYGDDNIGILLCVEELSKLECQEDIRTCLDDMGRMAGEAGEDFDQCWVDQLFLGIDVGDMVFGGVVPVSLMKRGAVMVLGKKAGKTLAAKYYFKVINQLDDVKQIVGKTSDKAFNKLDDFLRRTKTWWRRAFPDIGLSWYKMIADHLTGGKAISAANDLIDNLVFRGVKEETAQLSIRRIVDNFGEDYALGVFKCIDELKVSNIDPDGIKRLETMISGISRGFNDKILEIDKIIGGLSPKDIDNIIDGKYSFPSQLTPKEIEKITNDLKSLKGSLRGSLFEVIGNSHPDYLGKQRFISKNIIDPLTKEPITDYDSLLNDGTLLEFKSGVSIDIKTYVPPVTARPVQLIRSL